MALKVGQQLSPEPNGNSLTVKAKLGEGGQGAVYLVSGPRGDQAVKWYNPEQATDDQRRAIRDLIQHGPPRGVAGSRFIWPQAVVTAGDPARFGYLMPLIDTGRFAELGEVWAGRKRNPALDVLCEISSKIAGSYRKLHLDGFCYRDIARGNVMFDPASGEVLICDNDNIGVEGHSTCQVWGTLEYMAPELVRDPALPPSTRTDLHSLAVLLFQLWIGHHPLHGELEFKLRCWDLPAKKKIYGFQPVFIFDPDDRCNRLPNDSEYARVARRWDACPLSLRDLFLRAFKAGLHHPERRVEEGAWLRAFLQLRDGRIACPHCQAVNLWDLEAPGPPPCWNCGKAMGVPPRLVVAHAGGRHQVLLTADARILRRHVEPSAAEDRASDLVGEVVQNPAQPHVWGLRNQSALPWVATLADGRSQEVAPQKAIPLNAGMKLHIDSTVAEVVA